MTRPVRVLTSLVLALLAAAPALAQSPGTLNLAGPSTSPSAPQITTVGQLNGPINAALTAKADASGGVLTNPTLTNPTASGGVLTTPTLTNPTLSGTVNLAAGANVSALMVPFTTTARGAVPAPGAVLGYCLYDNGNWAACGTGSAGPNNNTVGYGVAFSSTGAAGAPSTPGSGGYLAGDILTVAGGVTATGTAATGAAGQSVVTFAALPANVYLGASVADITTAGVIASNATVAAVSGNAVTLSTPLTGAGVTSADTLTFLTPAQLAVLTASGGGVSRFQVLSTGVYSTIPPGKAIAVSGGGGTGATFPLLFGPLSAGVTIDNSSNGLGNVYVATGIYPAVNALGAVELTAAGWHAGGGQKIGSESSFYGYLAGGSGDSSYSVYLGGAGVALLSSGTGGSITPTVGGGTVNALAVAAGGTGYPNGTFALTITGGGCTGVTGTWTALAGAITAANVTNGGAGCTSAPNVALYPNAASNIQNDNTATGTDSLRHAAWATYTTSYGGGSCQFCGYNFLTGAGGQANYITAIGAGAEAFNADYVSAANFGVGVGNSACHGAGNTAPVGYFVSVTCVGSYTGASLTTGATNDLILGYLAGNSVLATGINDVLISPGGAVLCDTPASNTSNWFAVCGAGGPWFTATTTYPIVSVVANIKGSLVMGAATGGGMGAGTVNATAYYLNGAALTTGSGFTATYSASPIIPLLSGGTGNLAGDILTVTDGCTPSAKIAVTAVSGGAVTATGYAVSSGGICSVPPTGTLATTSSGGGSGATFNASGYAPLGNMIMPLQSTTSNMLLATMNAGFVGTGNILIGPTAALNLVGNATTQAFAVLSIGYQSCGGMGGAVVYLQQVLCEGYRAGAHLSGASGAPSLSIDAVGFLSLYSQAATTSVMEVYGAYAAYNENYGSLNARIAVFGPAECEGAAGTAAFFIAGCFGSGSGAILAGANTFLLLGQNLANTTGSGMYDVVLMGAGLTAINTPADSTQHWMNLGNVVIASTVALVPGAALSAGWGGSPTITGLTNIAFQVTLGASPGTSGTITMPTAAPHGWACGSNVVDSTTPGIVGVAVPTSPTVVTVSFYARGTATLTAPTAADVMTVGPCNGF